MTPETLRECRALVAYRNDQKPLPLGVLAILIGVHVRTLRNAARDGRLSVTHDTRTTFRRLRGRATPRSVEDPSRSRPASRVPHSIGVRRDAQLGSERSLRALQRFPLGSWRPGEDPARLWSLEALAAELGVHVRTLRNAARSGRLCVTFESRVVFGHLVPRATLAAGRTFIERYYKRCYSRTTPPPTPPRHTPVPADWPQQLRQIRADLALTQTQLAQRIGAAGKAVIYRL